LVPDKNLTLVAQDRAEDMSRFDYYSHRSPSGLYYYDLLNARGLSSIYSCENLDLNFSIHPEVYFMDWLSSTKGHRDCMLHRDTTRIGVAVVKMKTPNASTHNQTYTVVAIHAAPIEPARVR
jgi:uncharacterized protein YkwD